MPAQGTLLVNGLGPARFCEHHFKIQTSKRKAQAVLPWFQMNRVTEKGVMAPASTRAGVGEREK